MALIKCKECGEKVSTKAKSCPNCGAKPQKKTSIITWAVLALILFVVYGGWQTESNTTSKQIKATDEQRVVAAKAQVVAGDNSSSASAAKTSAPAVSAAVEKPKAPSDLEKARKSVEARFKGSADEPTSKDAVWTADDIFKVGVINDGTDRSGYAEYVCNVLYDYGFKGKKVWVQVIDIVKLTRSSKWEKLGEAHCL